MIEMIQISCPDSDKSCIHFEEAPRRTNSSPRIYSEETKRWFGLPETKPRRSWGTLTKSVRTRADGGELLVRDLTTNDELEEEIPL